MKIEIDASHEVVRRGEDRLPFTLDCRGNVVSVTLGDRTFQLRPLLWREKQSLARFAHLGPAFVKRQYVRLCLAEEARLPAEAADLDVLWTLAHWINAPIPDGETAPFDAALLASVTLVVCQALQRPPSDFDLRAAHEVEALWTAVRASHQDQQHSPEAEEHVTRIMVVPDDSPRSMVSVSAENDMPISQPTPLVEDFPAEAPGADGNGSRTTPAEQELSPETTAPRSLRHDATRDAARFTDRPRGDGAALSPRFRGFRMGAPSESMMNGVTNKGVRTQETEGDAALTRTREISPLAFKETPQPTTKERPTDTLQQPPHGLDDARGQPATPRYYDAPGDEAARRLQVMYPADFSALTSLPHPQTVTASGWRNDEETTACSSIVDLARRESLFEELADRLEEATAELGIDMEG